MQEPELARVSQEDIESLAEKLDGLAASMTAGERAALARVILNAATAAKPADPKWQAAFSGPLATNLAIGSNFTKEGQASPIAPISVGELRSKDRAFFRKVASSGR